MKWIKKGLIFSVDNNYDWMVSHASIPIPLILDEHILRIYFSSRDAMGRSRPAFIDVNINEPENILFINDKPLFDLGDIGTFDDNGIMPSSIIRKDDKIFMYYIGWNPQVTVSYRLSIGLAISHDNGISFQKYSSGPLLDRSLKEPFFNTAPYVIREDNIYKMWYVSCTGWKIVENHTEPVYLIKYAESNDGILWTKYDNICINYSYDGEALGRPCVIKENNIYKMWYSTRGSNNYRSKKGQHYRLGYAEAIDGINWLKKDDLVGIDVSEKGWDSEMIEYSSIYQYNNRKYMLYNGNGFGKSGFGYAILES